VIPVPENVATAPVSNPVPVITTASLLWFCADEAGNTEVTVGAAVTVKIPVPVPVPVSLLSTVIFSAPVEAEPETVTFAVMLVELVNVTVFTVTPVPEKVTVGTGPEMKPVPAIMTFWAMAPWGSVLGVADVTVTALVAAAGPAVTTRAPAIKNAEQTPIERALPSVERRDRPPP
jgi:hypothetical protein